jgi:hypothetical protein
MKKLLILTIFLVGCLSEKYYPAQTYVEHQSDNVYCVRLRPEQKTDGIPESAYVKCGMTLKDAYDLHNKMNAVFGYKE